MKTPHPHRAILVALLLVSPFLTTACGRSDAGNDQAALQKALSSVAVPTGLASPGEGRLVCELNIDCADIGSTLTFVPVEGNPCTAAVALQGNVPAETVRWKAVADSVTTEATQAEGALAGVAALPPNPAEMTAACMSALSAKQTFIMLSDLKPDAVPVKSAKAVLTVGDTAEEKPQPVIELAYDGPNW